MAHHPFTRVEKALIWSIILNFGYTLLAWQLHQTTQPRVMFSVLLAITTTTILFTAGCRDMLARMRLVRRYAVVPTRR